jgi:hypothetical protein
VKGIAITPKHSRVEGRAPTVVGSTDHSQGRWVRPTRTTGPKVASRWPGSSGSDNEDVWFQAPTPRDAAAAARALLRSGLIRLYRPDHLVRLGLGLTRYGAGPAVGAMAGACLYPEATAIIDDTGAVSMRELDGRCSAVADGLHAAGLWGGDAIGLLARNSAAFYETAVGASRLGLDVAYLNTGFVAAQVAELAESHRLEAVVHDPEFADRIPRRTQNATDRHHRSAHR